MLFFLNLKKRSHSLSLSISAFHLFHSSLPLCPLYLRPPSISSVPPPLSVIPPPSLQFPSPLSLLFNFVTANGPPPSQFSTNSQYCAVIYLVDFY